MPAMILRLLTVIALALMPFGMGTASAIPVHHAPAATAQHCDEHVGQPAEQSRGEALDCAVSCSMLAIAEARIDGLYVALPVLTARPLVERDVGRHPDTATPPPKLS